MRLLEAHGLRPDTDLGQHFLLDENLVDLSLRAGEVGPGDVALEVGPGVGVLTVALARAARVVHAVELDRRLEPALAEALAGHDNVRLHWGDAMRVDLEGLDPAPTRLIANLPYDIATPLVVESLWRLPSVAVWCVMVQREVAERWLAPPGSRLYGGASVLIALAAEPVFRRSVGREVFTPRPRVDSALVALRRTGPAPSEATRSLVRAAFGQRRKTLANALAGAGAEKGEVAAGLEDLGIPAGARASDLPPEVFPRLAERLAWPA
jgi:16S rRNA (adenine1518-N6/adenine1519-N6)-dimethyltransferase